MLTGHCGAAGGGAVAEGGGGAGTGAGALPAAAAAAAAVGAAVRSAGVRPGPALTGAASPPMSCASSCSVRSGVSLSTRPCQLWCTPTLGGQCSKCLRSIPCWCTLPCDVPVQQPAASAGSPSGKDAEEKDPLAGTWETLCLADGAALVERRDVWVSDAAHAVVRCQHGAACTCSQQPQLCGVID